MKNKFMRSVTAMVVAVTMLISSQGVVTSFADGEDYSDLSESSSVQMNEVGNNGTNQPTENGTGEDAAVKDVVEMINALPAAETITKETNLVSLKDQVNAARAAYDELSDDQKAAFNADVLGKLTALEAKISELESNDQETKPSDAVQTVVDAINALPAVETITEETDLVSLKDQVNAARAAYDALSDDQKAAFDAATLEKLTALEAKISELESGNQETAPSEVVQNVIEKIDAAVEQIDHTTETISATDGTTVTKTHITMLKDLDPANNAELKALIDKEAAHEQDENQPALTDEEAAKLSDARKAFEDAKAKYLSEGFSNAQLAARQAYDALAETDRPQVTNYSLLTDMETNIAYIMQAVNTLPEGEDVAMIGDEGYKTLDEAIAAAGDGATIEVLQDCTTANGIFLKDSLANLTIQGVKDKKPTITFTKYGIATLNKKDETTERSVTFKDCNVVMNGVGGTPYYQEWNWMTISLGTYSSLNLDNASMLLDGTGTSSEGKHTNAIYTDRWTSLNLNNNSILTIKNYSNNGISWNSDYTYNINIDNGSALNISNCLDGINGEYDLKVSNGSVVTISDCRSNGGQNLWDITIDNSKMNINNCQGNGLSAHNLTICNDSSTWFNENGNSGIVIKSLNLDGTSGMTFEGNGKNSNATGPALQIGAASTIDSGANLLITNNYRNGIDLVGGNYTVNLLSGVITNNGGRLREDGSVSYGEFGGGIYVGKQKLILSKDVEIFNNQSRDAGDDLHLNSSEGSIEFYNIEKVNEWILNETQLPITGWYVDGNLDGTATKRWKQDTQEDSYQLFNSFDENGKAVLNTVTSLKAAHAYSYNPETPPVNPDVNWERSKSKTATNLDANYQSQVTLSLPSAEEQLVSDVVFVLDKSTSGNVKDDAIKMLESLKSDIEENGAKVNVGIVIFNQAASRFGWYDLITEYDQIIEIFNKEIKDGTNLNAGLLAAKEMLEEHTDVDPNRKHMILVSDGISYYYCEGTNYQQGYTIASLNGGNDGEGSRNCTPDSTLSAWGIKYGTYGTDNEGFLYIPDWSQWESGMPALLSSGYTKYQYQVGSPDIPTEADSPKAVPFKERKNYPINVDISLYNSLKLYRDLASKYHCYAVLDGTTNKYTFGTPFMKYMAGETFVGSSSQEKFLNIKNDIFYLVDEGSSIVDVIGEGIDNAGNEYDFKFINDINNLNLTVNGISLPKEQIVENTSYGFGEKLDNGKYEFELTYYPDGIGKEARSQEVIAGELFRLDINVPITIDKPVQLTYTVQLTNPQTADGTYGQYDADGSKEYAGLYTNKMAILYPVDSNGVEGEQEAFQKPTVSYSISNGKPVDPPVDPEDPTPRPGGGGDEDDDTPTIINETPVPTTTIDDEDVPLTDLPEDTVTIDDEEVPLKDIPNTGDMIPVPAMVAAVISIGGIALLMKKHK